MDIDANPKSLLRSRKISMNDDFVIDSFMTGRQELKCLGRRVRISQRDLDSRVPKDKTDTVPPAKPSTASIQGIYATSLPLNCSPTIRKGISGAALVRSRTDAEGNVVDREEIAGFMQYTEARPKLGDGDGRLLYFVEALDGMIDEGWQVV